MRQYEKKLTEIWQESIKLRSKKIGFLSLPNQVESIEGEIRGGENELKKYQKKYFLEGTMSRTRYFYGLTIYRKVIAEMEKEKTIVEAKLEQMRNRKKSKLRLIIELLEKRMNEYLKKIKKRRIDRKRKV